VSLYNVDWLLGSAEFGRIVIGEPAARGKGYGLRATRLVLGIAGDAGLRTIHLEVKSDNAAAIRLYEKTGFVNTLSKDGLDIMQVELAPAPASSNRDVKSQPSR
jgi:RimJ/RimL family protein N-acetyltransferase